MLPTNHITFDPPNSLKALSYHYQYPDGKTKGLIRILFGRGLYKEGMKAAECGATLLRQPDVQHAVPLTAT